MILFLNQKILSFNSGITSQILGNFKNIRIEVKNVDIYKNEKRKFMAL